MSNNKNDNISKPVAKQIKIVNIVPTKNTALVQKKYPINKSTNQSISRKQIKSTNRKQIKSEVNLLVDSDLDNDTDNNTDNDSDTTLNKEENNLNKFTRLSYNDEKYKQIKQANPADTYNNPDDIKKKLQYYKRIESDDVINIPLGMRIKYVEILDNDEFKYKPGGALILNKAPEYLVLAANRKTWSVQLETHIIFVEEFERVRTNYDQTIKNLNNQIEKLKYQNNTLIKENSQLKMTQNKNVKFIDAPIPKKSKK